MSAVDDVTFEEFTLQEAQSYNPGGSTDIIFSSEAIRKAFRGEAMRCVVSFLGIPLVC